MGYIGIVDGPWACYVCAVFGDTAAGWIKHGQEKHLGQVVAGKNSQTYFWTDAWQEGEREADEDIRFGRTRRFVNADGAIAWLSDTRGSL